MHVLVAGASGFLGSALRTHLTHRGHRVTQLVRGDPHGPEQVRWDPYHGVLDLAVVETSDVVVNLAGAPIAHWPWTTSYKETLRTSRVVTTTTIANAIAEVERRPALVNASGVGYYGDRGDEVLDESSTNGNTFLAGICRDWEAAAEPAAEAGGRVCVVRTSPVLDSRGGALKPMRIAFGLGLGGRFGDGRQWFPSISLSDYLAAVTRVVTDETLSGPFNLVGPVPATNAEFTEALGRRLRRPTVLRVPSVAVRLAGGELSGEVLGSIRATPRRLDDAGFEFAHPTVDDQLRAAFDH